MTDLNHVEWRKARFQFDMYGQRPDEVLGLYSPAGSGLALADFVSLSLLPIHDWNGALQAELARGSGAGPAQGLSACVLAIDPFRRLRDLLRELRTANFEWVTNFPSPQTIDGGMRSALEELAFGLDRELQFVDDAIAMGLRVAAFANSTEAATKMVERGARALITPDATLIERDALPADMTLIELEESQRPCS